MRLIFTVALIFGLVGLVYVGFILGQDTPAVRRDRRQRRDGREAVYRVLRAAASRYGVEVECRG